MSRGVRLLQYALADYMGAEDGTAYPSVATLARDTGYHVRSMKRLIGEAEQSGWLVVKRRRRRTSLYMARFRGDVHQSEGDSHDTPTVTPESPKEPEDNQGITRTLSAQRQELTSSARPSVGSRRIHGAMMEGASQLWEYVGLPGFNLEDAGWVIDICGHLEDEIMEPGNSDPFDLAAEALADMVRKSVHFDRDRFIRFFVSTVRLREGPRGGNADIVETGWNGRDFRSGQTFPEEPEDFDWSR